MTKYDEKAKEKISKTMREFKKGELTIGKSDKKVTKPEQARAIALDKARREGAKVPKKKSSKKS